LERPYFRGMKPLLLFLILAIQWGSPVPFAFAQDTASRAAAIAAQQDFEERYKRLLAEMEEVKEALSAQQKRTAEVIEELRRLQEDNGRASSKFATREDLNSLVEKIREVDRKREEDQKLVLREFEKLAKAPPVVSAPHANTSSKSSSGTEKGFEYEIKSGDSYSAIVKAYNEEFKTRGIKERITIEQLTKANPKVNPAKLKVGQKIFVPDPSQ
jgi:LysM repeat protein